MKGYQKKYLKGLAHKLKPTVFIGHKGLIPSVIEAVESALDTHELIKVKFIDFKDKGPKKAMTATIEKEAGAALVGMIGHMSIFYRQHKDPQKRKINLP